MLTNQFETVLHEFRNGDTSDERNDALRSLGRAPPSLIPKVLELPLGDEVRTQDIYLPLAGLRTSAAGIEGLWSWFTTNWSVIEKKCPPGLSMLSTIVMICSSGFTKPEHREMIEKFFADKDVKGYEMSLKQSLDGVQAKMGWIQRDGANVEAWLKKGGYLS
jgi:aminopeptidase 2